MSRLLVTDLDGTLLGDEASLRLLLDLLEQPGAPVLAFASGRQGYSATKELRKWDVRIGSYLIAGVGTEMYHRVGKRWIQIASWPDLRSRWNATRVMRELEALDDLIPQPLPAPSPYKLSYFAPPSAARVVRETLRTCAIEATVVHSHGSLLDVLPGGIDKGSATAWLTKHLSVRLDGTITCGNTANDMAMLELPCESIVVGNSDADLVEAAATLPRTFVAAKACAAGIMEGLRYFGWLNESGWTA